MIFLKIKEKKDGTIVLTTMHKKKGRSETRVEAELADMIHENLERILGFNDPTEDVEPAE